MVVTVVLLIRILMTGGIVEFESLMMLAGAGF